MASFAVALLMRRVHSLRVRALSVTLPRRWSSSLSCDSDSDSLAAASYASESGLDEPSTPLRDKEKEIMKDIEPIRTLTKDILHSKRYRDGECLSAEDEKEIIEKILHYHPHSEDKIGCGLSSIVVDRHPDFRYSRCLFVARTDGDLVDFSYTKCLKTYIRNKYPSHAEWFILKHFGRK